MHYVRYRLQPYSGVQSRHRCPACKHRRKTFTRYIHPHTGEHLADHVGLCDRVLKCGYHFTPRRYFAETGNGQTARKPWQRTVECKPPPVKPVSYMNVDHVNQTLDHYKHNNFVLYLIDKLGVDMADELVKLYLIGTSSRWPGATIFWQIDGQGKVRTGKIMLYNRETGKRVRQPYNHITWAHLLDKQYAVGNVQRSVIPDTLGANCNPKTENFNLKQCFFGEYLLTAHPDKPVAIVESEKTAIIVSGFMPAFIWLASGSLDGLKADKCRILKNRKVMLFPDANGYRSWKLKADELQKSMPGTVFKVSYALELIATEADRLQGIDLGDVILQQAINPDR